MKYNLSTGSGARHFTGGPYDFSLLTGVNLSTNYSSNKIQASLIGFDHGSVSSTDIAVYPYLINTTHFSVLLQTQVSDFWNRLDILICIINF
jgi:hypothetical protein